MKRFQFYTFTARELFTKAAIWMGGVMLVVIALEFVFAFTILDNNFDHNWAEKFIAFLVFSLFAGGLFQAYIAMSKSEFIDDYCQENSLSKGDFLLKDAKELQRLWLEHVGADDDDE